MTRHAPNCTAGAVYTYNEKKKDAAGSGYGTNAQRLGKPCRNPVFTIDDYLFDREPTIQQIIKTKNEYTRKIREEKKRLKKQEDDAQTYRKQLANLEQFVKSGKPVNGTVDKPSTSKDAGKNDESSISNMANGNAKKLPSFWLPSECPNAGKAEAQKPDPTIYCPVPQFTVQDVIDVKFTLLKDGDSKSLIAKEARCMCPVTHDVLSNAVPCAVLRPTPNQTANIVTAELYQSSPRVVSVFPLHLSSNMSPATCDHTIGTTATITNLPNASRTMYASTATHTSGNKSRRSTVTHSTESDDLKCCGFVASVILTLAFVVGINVYFDNHGTKFEVGSFFLLTAICVIGFCCVSICICSAPSSTSSRSGSRDQTVRDHCSMDDTRGSVVNSFDVAVVCGLQEFQQKKQLQQVSIGAQQVQAGPPPYHIAILLPESKVKEDIEQLEELPPPSYDKILI